MLALLINDNSVNMATMKDYVLYANDCIEIDDHQKEYLHLFSSKYAK